jgi:hypothetical protein
MARTKTTTVDWPTIRERWQGGETASEIARTVDVTRQAIQYRARREGWDRTVKSPAVLHGAKTGAGAIEAWGRRSPENAEFILTALRAGVPEQLAVRRIGMDRKTFLAWRADEPDFDAACIEATSTWIAEKLRQIDDTGDRDWKAAAYRLERHPDTKELFHAETRGGGTRPEINVIVNVPEPVGFEAWQRQQRADLDLEPENE